jgi:hypothetical protein
MVDITEISAIVAAAGVLVGVVYYIFDMRNQSRMRKTELLTRLYSAMVNKDWLEAWDKIDRLESDDLIKMRTERRMVEINLVYAFFDEVGVLLKKGLVDMDLVENLIHGHAIRTWEKLKPTLEHGRKLRNDPNIAEGFEYLYNEMKKREQSGADHV